MTIARDQAPGVCQNTISDDVLIKQIAGQDEAGFAVLVRRYQSQIHRFVRRFVHDHGLAEDIASETFFAAWQQAASFQGRSSVRTWLLAIARHKALSIRQRGDRQEDSLDNVATILIDPNEGPEDKMVREDLSGFLHRSLVRLPVEQEALVQLIYYREKTLGEAARIVGIPENTAKSRMFLARRKLAVVLHEAGAVQRNRNLKRRHARTASGTRGAKSTPADISARAEHVGSHGTV
jgi:RNA polymerase sigma-70 factor (ECF subfamily)